MNSLFPIFYSLLILLFPYIGKCRYSRQSLSSIAISLGLLGTFICIIYGLINFNTEQIGFSVTLLLESLKLAILATLTGLFTSLLLRLFPSLYGIKKEKLIESDPIAEKILNTLAEISQNTSIRDINISTTTGISSDSNILQELQKLHTQNDHLLNSRLEQIQQLIQEMNNNLISSLNKQETVAPDFSKILNEQMGQLTVLVKNNEEQLKQQINQMEEKHLQEVRELENFTRTMMSIIKKLNQDHNTLYKTPDTASEQ